MLKNDQNSNDLKERLFVLTEKYLYYTKGPDSNVIRGVMQTKFVKVNFFSEDKGQPCFGIRFIKNMKFCDLFARDERQWKDWKIALAPVMVQGDFHSKFGVVKMVGKGSFAKVYLVQNKENN